MKNLLTCMVLGLALYTQPSFAQKPKPDYKKNSVQIGKTGYYFDQENPFGFGREVFIYTYLGKAFFMWPYIGYTRKITPSIGFKASIEHYGACYECQYYGKRWPPIPVFEIGARFFQILQINGFYEFSASERLKLILSGGSGYRWSTEIGELWNTAYIDHGLWREAFASGKAFNEWGVGGAFEIKYKFYKNFSLSAKGEYFSFPKRPVRHWGAGAYIGYDF